MFPSLSTIGSSLMLQERFVKLTDSISTTVHSRSSTNAFDTESVANGVPFQLGAIDPLQFSPRSPPPRERRVK